MAELKNLTATAAAALRSGDPTGWGWGEDVRVYVTHPTSKVAPPSYLMSAKTRPLSVHVNCIRGGHKNYNTTFINKELILRAIDSWYVVV